MSCEEYFVFFVPFVVKFLGATKSMARDSVDKPMPHPRLSAFTCGKNLVS